MGRKYEVTGKAVIYTKDGVKVVDSDVRRLFNINQDSCTFKTKETGEYLLVGGARTVPTDNIYAKAAYNPERVDAVFKYASTKFFRLILDLQRLAQFEPIHRANCPMNYHWFSTNRLSAVEKPDIDFSVSVPEIDAQLYRKYDFTPAMIKFVEERYSYDDALHNEQD